VPRDDRHGLPDRLLCGGGRKAIPALLFLNPHQTRPSIPSVKR